MGTHPIRFGIQTSQQNVAWKDMLNFWQKADGWGYDSLWAFDHFYPIYVDPEGDCFEGWTLLSALTMATKNARVGHLVNGNTYRHPCVTAKMAATLDHISDGRLNLGLGAGWFELEHENFGLDFKTVVGRLAALEEALQIVKGMFTQHKTTVHGKHYTVTDAMGDPKPLQEGGPPIMIGGGGKKILLRLVAQYADQWNFRGSAEFMGGLVDIIKQHGDAVGRDTDQIEKSVMMPLVYNAPEARVDFWCNMTASMQETTPDVARASLMAGSKQECLDTIERYANAGVTHFIFMAPAPYFLDEVQAFAEDVMPEVR